MHRSRPGITTQTQAKRFFVEKVEAQARAEGTLLSEAEGEMLSWSESDPDIKVDPVLPDRLAAEISDDAYEEKTAGLLSRRFSADIAADTMAEDEWKHALRVLDEGDHYISIMIQRAIGD
jgi:hypothetical protein